MALRNFTLSDYIAAHVLRRVPFTVEEHDEVLLKVEAALETLEIKGEDGILKARSLLYEIHDLIR